MSKASKPMAMASRHTTSISDLDLDGVPASHRHGVRALRARLSEVRGISIDHIKSNSGVTRVFLRVKGGKNSLMSVFDIRTALSATGVERANIQFGGLRCLVLDGPLGFEV